MSGALERLRPAELARRFESLGHDCEFGLFQRWAGAEPLGLMRFTAHSFEALRHALQNRFEHLTAELDATVDAAGNYITHARRIGFSYDTSQRHDSIGKDELISREVRRLSLLRRKLIEDLESGEKIFVRRSYGAPAEHEVRGLKSDLDAYGPATLLWVHPADDARPDGSLELEPPGLMHGYLNPRDENPHAFIVDHRGWMRLCRKALRARVEMAGGPAPAADEPPTGPSRVVPARNAAWEGDLELGSNGRVRHVQHGSLGDFYQREDVLHVQWDLWPSELFIERRGVFLSAALLGLTG